MNRKKQIQTPEKKYVVPESESLSVNEPEALYEICPKDTLAKPDNQSYYTVDEYFSFLKNEINKRAGYELISGNS